MKLIGTAICGNETQEVIQRAINNFKKICDKIYILDNYGNCSFIKDNKVIVINKKYEQFSFGQARQDCLDYIEKNEPQCYCISYDIDDCLPDNFQLPELTKDCYSIKYKTSSSTSHIHYRIFKSHIGIKWSDCGVHEFLVFDRSIHSVEDLSCEVLHAPLSSKNKNPSRNYDILKREQNTLRQTFYMAQELCDLGRYQEGCIYYQHYINRCKYESHWFEELMCSYWKLARYTIDKNEALKIVEEGLSLFPNCGELYFEKAYREGTKPIMIQWHEHLFGERDKYAI